LDWFFENYRSAIVGYSSEEWPPKYSHWYHVDVGLPYPDPDEGALPWFVESYFDMFVQYLEEGNWGGAAEFAGKISHLIGDGSNPLHATSDYNPGGNHLKFEEEVDKHLGEIDMSMPGFKPQELENVFDSTMEFLLVSYSHTSVLNPYLRSGILWNDEIKDMTEERLRASAQLHANIWYTGMVLAGLATSTTHAPILIVGNDNFTSAKGVVGGSGTEEDPYIIENWDINAETAPGIKVINTTAHFIIKNCYVYNGRINYNHGIYFDNVINGIVDNNIVENNYFGIIINYGYYNLILNNIVKNNSGGINLKYSDNNLIYHNNFVNNTNQANDDGSNFWDNGYPSGGNYWSDYTGTDFYRGENQYIPGSDGIGDTPYYIPGDNNRDRYPLMGLSLVAGWNLVGFMGFGENGTPDNMFAGMSYTMFYWVAPGGPYRRPFGNQPVEDNLGYWVKLDRNWQGRTSVAPDNRTIYLVAGWNLVHFPVTSANTTPDNMFAGMTYTMYYWTAPGGPYKRPFGDQPVQLGVGYWVKLDNDKTLTVPL
jgi:parallel beta-helix repeat protein